MKPLIAGLAVLDKLLLTIYYRMDIYIHVILAA